MADRTLEARLDAFFADIPPMADAQHFAVRVEERLDRSWTFRRFVIGGLGLAGGLIGGAQMLSGGLLGRLGEAETRSGAIGKVVTDHLADSPVGAQLAHDAASLVAGVGQGEAQALLMSVALALFAGGLLITRALREF